MLDRLHGRDVVLGDEVLDGGIEEAVVQVGAGLDCFGPEAVGAGVVDVRVYCCLLGSEGAVSVFVSMCRLYVCMDWMYLFASSTERIFQAIEPSSVTSLKSDSSTRTCVVASSSVRSSKPSIFSCSRSFWLRTSISSSSRYATDAW